MAKEMLNVDCGLFQGVDWGDNHRIYSLYPVSYFNERHSSYLTFIGHIVGKAIYDNAYLNCTFAPVFYKQILSLPIEYTDMKYVDKDHFDSLQQLLDNDIATLKLDNLTFSFNSEYGQTNDLCKDGRNIQVTNDNKQCYVNLLCEFKLNRPCIRKQLTAFLTGFYDIIPKHLIQRFNERELELIVSGLVNIDIDDLKANTEYYGYQPNSPQIVWLWRTLYSFDKCDLSKFLQFVTGTITVPIGGFKELQGMDDVQNFQVHRREDCSTDYLPTACTCRNQLSLPVYESYEKLREKLLLAVREYEGFAPE
ncbi:unnamed protein product [Didymodactylos carnosus]|uniref:HECT-type E3 ubiquitin transferase n=2 Tax=Didymodactylos carnosus TaxID=1234261 RepID=A0A814QIL4_9BILA|nr:unnamed protein product [Didymodactylos carnosus]CAF3883571.1 unnamed protein product [Didymodactylos carnosus]